MEALVLVVAGFLAGLAGSIAGLASIVSYPALLAVGLPPVAANVTNSVALVCISLGSITGSRRELVGQGPRIRRLAPWALVGGIVGAALLLLTPERVFALLVPFLVGGASVVMLLPRPSEEHPGRADSRWLPPTIGSIAVYSGYFGAAAGVMYVAALLHGTGLTLARANAARNAIAGISNGVSAVAFVAFGPVEWWAAAPLAVGLLVGGYAGPSIVRRAPQRPLRVAIGLAGIAVAVSLLVRALGPASGS